MSGASLWEMALKCNVGKLSFILRTLEIARHHVDPFDGILIAQALTENIPVITPDLEISKYPVQVIW